MGITNFPPQSRIKDICCMISSAEASSALSIPSIMPSKVCSTERARYWMESAVLDSICWRSRFSAARDAMTTMRILTFKGLTIPSSRDAVTTEETNRSALKCQYGELSLNQSRANLLIATGQNTFLHRMSSTLNRQALKSSQ